MDVTIEDIEPRTMILQTAAFNHAASVDEKPI